MVKAKCQVLYGSVVQLVNTSLCHSEERPFEPGRSRHIEKENSESLASSKVDEKPVNGLLHYVLYRSVIILSASGDYHIGI